MKEYNHKKIETKWQKEWDKNKIYQASNKSKKSKYYTLIEFPYPSGAGLHVGHIRSNTAMDVVSRKRRMQGYNVLYPIGWDAFGLPTENYAIKTGKNPEKVTKENTDMFRKQLKSIGFSFDWSREINTTDPKYYKWTQWIFLKFLENGLAYKKKMSINWCPVDKTGLANEEVVAGCCERCGAVVEKREKEQWMLAITKYADRLDKDLDDVNYLEKIKIQQRNWIGKSEGAQLEFKITCKGSTFSDNVKVFTTRPDTLYGATYVVLAPEHELVKKFKNNITNWTEVQMYQIATIAKNEIDRTAEDKQKTGVELKGIKATNPATGEEIPVWIADYVLAGYGTGAIMAVPAHDERDFDFATKFSLPIVQVIDSDNRLINSGRFTGIESEKAKKEIIKFVGGEQKVSFKLRDWVFSRQRYWGEPIPVIHCDSCGIVPVPEKDLPVELPKVKNYAPTDSGESPLAAIDKWVNTKCPKCKGKAKRETDTMPNWAGSSWYFLRYIDTKNNKAFAGKKELKYWLGSDALHGGVDWYNGGNEHTTLHLLYSRFWHKFLFDLGLVPTHEPYAKRTSHGLILADDGTKFSKTKGNGIKPEDIVDTFGADSLRVYQMFMGPFDQAVSWSSDGLVGPRRFLEKVWRIADRVSKPKAFTQSLPDRQAGLGSESYSATPSQKHMGSSSLHSQPHKELTKLLHKTIKKVSEDIEEMRFNTAISSMMIMVSEMEKEEIVEESDFKIFLKLLAPFAPHITEELWFKLPTGPKSIVHKSIHLSSWPEYDPSMTVDTEVNIVVQVAGKVRSNLKVPVDSGEEEVTRLALADAAVVKHIPEAGYKKIIYIKNKLINIVI